MRADRHARTSIRRTANAEVFMPHCYLSFRPPGCRFFFNYAQGQDEGVETNNSKGNRRAFDSGSPSLRMTPLGGWLREEQTTANATAGWERFYVPTHRDRTAINGTRSVWIGLEKQRQLLAVALAMRRRLF